MNDNLISSFYETLRKGQALTVTEQRGFNTGVAKLPPTRMDSMPTFDCGHLNDPGHPDCWPKALYDELWNEYVEAGDLALPFNQCVFVFRWRETAVQYETINYYLVEREGDGILLRTFFRHPHNTGLLAQLTRNAASLFVNTKAQSSREQMVTTFYARRSNFTDASQANFVQDLRAAFTAVVGAVLLMNRRRVIREEVTEPAMAAVNAGRVKAKLAPIPAPIRVKLGTTVLRMIGDHDGEGGTRSPHDRRGHWRNYKSGKRTWVRDCKIHGGSDEGREYVVTR